jgi:hypothetical protein
VWRSVPPLLGDEFGDDLGAGHVVEPTVEQTQEQITTDLPDQPRMPGPLRGGGKVLRPYTRGFGLVGG